MKWAKFLSLYQEFLRYIHIQYLSPIYSSNILLNTLSLDSNFVKSIRRYAVYCF